MVHAVAHTVNVHYSIYDQTVKQNGIGTVQIKVCIFNGLQRVVYQNCIGSNLSSVRLGLSSSSMGDGVPTVSQIWVV